MRIKIYPGSADAEIKAVMLFGRGRVCQGAWTDPVIVHGLSGEEVDIALELFEEEGWSVEVFPEGSSGG